MASDLDRLVLRLPTAHPRLRAAPWTAAGPVVAAADGKPATRRYIKAIARVGEFVKPAEGAKYTVTPAVLHHWAEQFAAFSEAGIDVPVPFQHKGESAEDAIRKGGDPRNNAGWVREMWTDGQTLWAAMELVGEDAFKATRAGQVSIMARKSYAASNGVTYDWPITHVALVTNPVFTGLGDFLPLAAALGPTDGGVAMLDFLKQMAGMLGLNPEEITDEAAGAEMIAKALEAVLAKTKPAEGDTATASTATAAASTAAVKKETVTKEFVASADNTPAPMLVSLAVDNRKLKIDALTRDGFVSPAQAKSLTERFATKERVAASLAAAEDDSDFDGTLATFRLGPKITNSGRTGAQNTRVEAGHDPSKGVDPKPNPLMAEMDRRAKAFAGAK